MSEVTKVVIVGAGITGLTLAHQLRQRGIPHLVLEAENRVGGVVRSDVVGGHLLERGPQRTRLTKVIEALIRELGIEDQLITAPPGLPLFVHRGGKLRQVPFTPAEFAQSSIVSLAGKVRLLMEPATASARDDETVAAYFTRKVGRELYESLLGPLYGGLYASDPEDMIVGLSLGHVLREFGIRRSLLLPLLKRGGRIAPPAACSFRDGLGTLPRVLGEANREAIRLGNPVTGIGRDGRHWHVEARDGAYRAEHIVLTVPAAASARLLEGVAPAAARSIGKLTYNPLAVAYLHAPDADLTGLGYQVAFGERLVTRGVTFNHSLFGRAGVYTAYLGGAKARMVANWSDSEVAAVAVREFREVTGFGSEAVHIGREWMPAWDRSWAAVAKLGLPEHIHIAANWHSRPGIPGRLADAVRLADRLASQP